MIGTVRFSCEGHPVGKERARTFGLTTFEDDGHGGRRRVPVLNGNGKQRHRSITPVKTQAFEAQVGYAFLAKCHGQAPHDGPVHLRVTCVFMPPKYLDRKQIPEDVRQAAIDAEGEAFLTTTDADNVTKAVKDALQGLAYLNDRQVTNEPARKIYGARERVDVELEFLPWPEWAAVLKEGANTSKGDPPPIREVCPTCLAVMHLLQDFCCACDYEPSCSQVGGNCGVAWALDAIYGREPCEGARAVLDHIDDHTTGAESRAEGEGAE